MLAGVIVGAAVAITAYYFPGPHSKPPVRPGNSWSEENDYGVALANAAAFGPVTVPTRVSPVFVQGNLSVLSWHQYERGGKNVTGNCSASAPETGICNVYDGVGSPVEWSVHSPGGLGYPAEVLHLRWNRLHEREHLQFHFLAPQLERRGALGGRRRER